ncbi:hypothetical protein ES702_07550 [subsurface metagenome]
MEIYYTPHALLRLQKRGISKQLVNKVLAEPGIKTPAINPKRSRWIKKFGDRFLDIIFEKRRNRIIIITAAWSKKEKK